MSNEEIKQEAENLREQLLDMKRDDVDIIAEFLSSFAARARNEGIEAGAKIMDKLQEDALYSARGCASLNFEGVGPYEMEANRYERLANNIRSLKSQEATDGK